MSTQIVCDECERVVYQRSAGWVTVITHRGDVDVERHLCSDGCVRKYVADEFPERRPNFPAAHAELNKALEQQALDDAIDDGLFAGEPYEPVEVDDELAAYIAALPKGRRSHASRAADVIHRLRVERGEATG